VSSSILWSIVLSSSMDWVIVPWATAVTDTPIVRPLRARSKASRVSGSRGAGEVVIRWIP